MSYTIGNTVRLSVEFLDAAGALVDPTDVTCRLRGPESLAAISLPVTKESVGKYHADALAEAAGVWFYRFAGSGTVDAAVEGSFIVNRPLADFS